MREIALRSRHVQEMLMTTGRDARLLKMGRRGLRPLIATILLALGSLAVALQHAAVDARGCPILSARIDLAARSLVFSTCGTWLPMSQSWGVRYEIVIRVRVLQ
jgi:hypothetical protein